MGSLRWSNRSGKPSAKETCRGYASRTSCKLPEENSKRTQGLFELDNLRLREAYYVRRGFRLRLGPWLWVGSSAGLVAVFTPQGCERTIPHDPAAESGLREALEKQCFP